MLKIKNLKASVNNKLVLGGINLNIKKGETVVIMGPNGSGKSTLSHIIMGDPKFKVINGLIKFKNKDILKLSPDARAGLGVFMAYQHPREIAGVEFNNFLFTAYKNIATKRGIKKILSIFEFQKKLEQEAKELKIKPELLNRDLNKGFSGGEKKKVEILQLKMLSPSLAIFDETDSGLDVDALKIIGTSIQGLKKDGIASLVVTHFSRLLKYIKPDVVHVMVDGKIVKTGDIKLVQEIESKGYKNT